MEQNRGIIREPLKFEFELGHSAKEAMDNINRAKGNGIMSKAIAYLWYSKFRSNKMDIVDKKGDTGFLATLVARKKFRTIEEMRQSLTEFFDSKDREWYRRGIHQLEEQWKKVIESGGEYFDY
uniref:Mos1 transposase HTH domain-containing protein n=1 Tax=Acrobeloides nanus TaxID=290746 RepID=A0A914E9R9_9BILA